MTGEAFNRINKTLRRLRSVKGFDELAREFMAEVKEIRNKDQGT